MKRSDVLVIIAIWDFVTALPALIGIAILGAFGFPAVIDLSGAGQVGGLFGLSMATLVLLGYFGLSVAAGIGLLTLKEWGRVLAIVRALLDLVAVPVGTIIGVLTLVYLMTPATRSTFRAGRDTSAVQG